MKFQRFGLGIAKGLAVTLKHLGRKPITVQYPEQRLSPSRRMRGTDFIWVQELCTGCGACARACPHGNIELVTSKKEGEKGVKVDRIEIDRGRSMFCGLCIEACPTGALRFEWAYEKARYRREELISDKEALMPQGRTASAYARPDLEAELPEQTLLLYKDEKEH